MTCFGIEFCFLVSTTGIDLLKILSVLHRARQAHVHIENVSNYKCIRHVNQLKNRSALKATKRPVLINVELKRAEP